MKQQFSDSTINTCWVNGQIYSPEETAVVAVDHSIIVGDGVFETIKVINGRPFALTRHLERMKRSATGMGFKPADSNLVISAVEEVLKNDKNAERLRVTWSSGPGPLSSSRGKSPGTLIIASSGGTSWPETEKIHLCQWTRNENSALTGLKTTSYAENVVALQVAHEKNCSESIFLNTAGNICEGTGTNIFFVIDDMLTTPSLKSGCLAGITRELVIGLAAVEERDILPEEIKVASEAFLTSSTRDLSPISAIDETVFPEAPGPKTIDLVERFADLVANNLDP